MADAEPADDKGKGLEPQMDPGEVTSLLRAWSAGDREARDELVPLVVSELRRLAGSFFAREKPGHTLQPTALVNEVYLRLVGCREVHWDSRAQFFGFAATSMRRILVDHARARLTAKRGAVKVPLDEAGGLGQERDVDLIALDQALDRLAEMNLEHGRIVELRCFAGLTLEETARIMGIGERSVSRGWRAARAWLRRELERGSSG